MCHRADGKIPDTFSVLVYVDMISIDGFLIHIS